jgi:hypothetical protein
VIVNLIETVTETGIVTMTVMTMMTDVAKAHGPVVLTVISVILGRVAVVETIATETVAGTEAIVTVAIVNVGITVYRVVKALDAEAVENVAPEATVIGTVLIGIIIVLTETVRSVMNDRTGTEKNVAAEAAEEEAAVAVAVAAKTRLKQIGTRYSTREPPWFVFFVFFFNMFLCCWWSVRLHPMAVQVLTSVSLCYSLFFIS